MDELEYMAKICHDANKSLCEANGDYSQKSWEEAEQWQKDSAIDGVKYVSIDPDKTGKDQHEIWVSYKLKHGWRWGPVKDAVAKTHPCIIPYENLSKHEKQKDALFRGIVKALS